MAKPPKPIPAFPGFQEGVHLWGLLSPDKTTLRVHDELLNQDALGPLRSKGPVTITHAGGNYYDVSLHAEGMGPGCSEIQQWAVWLVVLVCNGVFRLDVGWSLAQVCRPDWVWDVSHTIGYVETLRFYGFLLAEREVAADFPCNHRPIRVLKKETGHKFRSTLYSNDGTKSYRLVFANGVWKKHSKGSRKDFVAEYDRARKVGSSEPLWRIELRLQRHHLDRLSIYDLCLEFHTWLIFRQAWLVKFLRKAVPAKAWAIRESELRWNHWGFGQILKDAGWETC